MKCLNNRIPLIYDEWGSVCSKTPFVEFRVSKIMPPVSDRWFLTYFPNLLQFFAIIFSPERYEYHTLSLFAFLLQTFVANISTLWPFYPCDSFVVECALLGLPIDELELERAMPSTLRTPTRLPSNNESLTFSPKHSCKFAFSAAKRPMP